MLPGHVVHSKGRHISAKTAAFAGVLVVGCAVSSESRAASLVNVIDPSIDLDRLSIYD